MKELLKMLELQNVTKVFDNKPILKNLCITVAPGEAVALIGPNGAGKSTAFKCIAGLMKPTNGKIIVDGTVVKKNSIELKKKVGYLGHESFLYETFSPVENLRFYGKLYKTPQLDQVITNLLKKVGLYRFRDMSVGSFSRGMIQRLAIAKMFLGEPKLLMLDEPHTGLDQGAISLLNSLIKEQQTEGKSLLLISHDFEQILSLCDRAAVLYKGRIVADTAVHKHDLVTFREWYAEAVIES